MRIQREKGEKLVSGVFVFFSSKEGSPKAVHLAYCCSPSSREKN
jgi:hypothetical protein